MVARRLLAALLAGGALVPATPAPAGATPPLAPRDALLWATINVCDTVGHPDGVGVRGSMPGTGDRRDALFMRLRLQYRTADGRWRRIGRSGDSGLLALGRGDARVRQAGRTFTVTPPGEGRPAFVLRGLVTFEWRRGQTVLRRAWRATQAGRPGTPGADPAGFSAATCSVR
ncbi:MAG TPA: hypothetical protein VHF51_06755 [Solirubrobacteraceae bacterium]|nr:hypothetical protein [Solirubrobacteraceae bacterium]